MFAVQAPLIPVLRLAPFWWETAQNGLEAISPCREAQGHSPSLPPILSALQEEQIPPDERGPIGGIACLPTQPLLFCRLTLDFYFVSSTAGSVD
jgi:hypothetical protein